MLTSDQELAIGNREALQHLPKTIEKYMFGGVCLV